MFFRLPSPLLPGTYPIDPADGTALFAFGDDATSITLPESPATTDFDAWVAEIPSLHRFLSVVGSVTIVRIDSAALQGVFSLSATDLATGLPVLIPDGVFSVGSTSAVRSGGSWGGIKAQYRD